jgi:gliding motility associated protien GldN
MPVYEKSSLVGDIRPYFNLSPMAKEMIPTVLNTDRTGELGDGNIATSEYMLLNYDSVADKMTFNGYSYNSFVRNQLKFMIQEIIFFDKHYSRLYSKITAIAPMHADNVAMNSEMDPMQAVYGQILFWIKYDDLRPYLAQQYVTATDNNSNGVTLDDFFTLKLYSSYVLGVNNVYSRMVPQFVTNESDLEVKQKAIHREQRKIENELLNTEQDLWEY